MKHLRAPDPATFAQHSCETDVYDVQAGELLASPTLWMYLRDDVVPADWGRCFAGLESLGATTIGLVADAPAEEIEAEFLASHYTWHCTSYENEALNRYRVAVAAPSKAMQEYPIGTLVRVQTDETGSQMYEAR